MSSKNPDKTRSHGDDLLQILCTTRSQLAYHSPYMRESMSLRILDFALLNAITDLEPIDAPSLERSSAEDRPCKGP